MENKTMIEQRIDIERILEKKMPSLKKRLPKFVISYIKRAICQDEINRVYNNLGHLNGYDFAHALLQDEFKIKYNVIGEEHLPKNSQVIFACNHPLGGADGIVMIDILGKIYSSLKIPVNDFLMNIENLREFFIPINKISGQAKSTSLILNEVCSSDDAILFFPSGQCSRRQDDGTIRDNEWKKTFISKSTQYQRDIIPIHFEGKNSNFFYNLAYYRKKLGIKANIEMLYLPSELFKQRGNTFTIKIGKPIPYTTFDRSKSEKEWAQWVKEITYNL
jgi:putative hemolysin